MSEELEDYILDILKDIPKCHRCNVEYSEECRGNNRERLYMYLWREALSVAKTMIDYGWTYRNKVLLCPKCK